MVCVLDAALAQCLRCPPNNEKFKMLQKRNILSLAALIFTFLLILVGGLVHSTGSSLACPDWPLCFGQVFPEMKGGVLYEHSHRLLASLVAWLTLALAVTLFRTEKNDKTLRILGPAVFGLVIFQAVLGGITVIYKLPRMVSTTHLATAMFFFASILFITVRLYLNKKDVACDPTDLRQAKNLRSLLFLGIVFLYSQIVLGAFMRHTGAGAVCTTIPLCEGEIWPELAHPAIRLHMLHRLGGVFTFIWLTLSAFFVFRRAKFTSPFAVATRTISAAVPFLMILQIVLGFISAITFLAIPPVMLHLGLATFLFGTQVFLWSVVSEKLRQAKLKNPSAFEETPSLTADLLSLSKARLGTFVLVTTAISFYIAPASRTMPFATGVLTIVGTFLLSSGSSFLNAYFERHSDGKMERTKDRPLVVGRLPSTPIYIAGALLGVAGIVTLSFFTNPMAAVIGAIAFIFYAFIYTPLKSRTAISTLIGAIPGSLPVLIGYTAATGTIDAIGTTLFFILFFWQLPHFFAIATFRQKEYENAGIKVLPSQTELLTRKMMLRYTAMLIPLSLLLVPLGIAGKTYFYVALVLGLTYFAWAGYGLRPLSGIRWAKSLFVFSLVYLPTLFVTLFLDSNF